MSKLEEFAKCLVMLLLYFSLFLMFGVQLWFFTTGSVVHIHDKQDKVVEVPKKEVYSLNDVGRRAESKLISECGGRKPSDDVIYRVKWEAIYTEAINQGYDEKEAIELVNKCLGEEAK